MPDKLDCNGCLKLSKDKNITRRIVLEKDEEENNNTNNNSNNEKNKKKNSLLPPTPEEWDRYYDKIIWYRRIRKIWRGTPIVMCFGCKKTINYEGKMPVRDWIWVVQIIHDEEISPGPYIPPSKRDPEMDDEFTIGPLPYDLLIYCPSCYAKYREDYERNIEKEMRFYDDMDRFR